MKKTKVIISLLISAVLVITFIGSAAAVSYKGDLNGDGKVKAGEARTILRVAAGLETIDPALSDIADLDSNGKIKAADARLALRIAAGLEDINAFAIGKDEPSSQEAPSSSEIPERTTAENKPTMPTRVPVTTTPTTTEVPATETPATEIPTTEAPTTEAPTTETPTTEAPTTEVPTTEEPTTEAPTTEVPTTEEPTTEPVSGELLYYDKYYMSLASYNSAGVKESEMSFATDGKNSYIRTPMEDGGDVGILIKDNGKKIDIKKENGMYMFLYEQQEMIFISNSVFSSLETIIGESLDMSSLIGEATAKIDIRIPVLSDYNAMNLTETRRAGETYGIYKTTREDGNDIIFYYKKGENVPSIIEFYDADGNIVSTLAVYAYTNDPSPYFDAPTGMHEFRINSLTDFIKYIDDPEFMKFMDYMS